MTLDEVVAYFGSGYAVCNVLMLKQQNFTHWKKRGYIPEVHQFRLEKLTNGALKAELPVKEKQYKKRLIVCPHCKGSIDLNENQEYFKK